MCFPFPNTCGDGGNFTHILKKEIDNSWIKHILSEGYKFNNDLFDWFSQIFIGIGFYASSMQFAKS